MATPARIRVKKMYGKFSHLKNVLRIVHAEPARMGDEVWQHQPPVVVGVLCNHLNIRSHYLLEREDY
jgi:hypothetical protein